MFQRTSIKFILFCSLFLCASCVSFSQALPSSAEMARLTESHLSKLAKDDQFSGVVLLAKDGRPIFRKAYGFSNLADHVPNRLDTKFNVASMGKMFTAVAIMQLVQSGKLSLEDAVGKYLPSYPNETVRDTVTISQLLTHTSGLPDFLAEYDKISPSQYKAVSDYLPLFAEKPLLFPPGTSFAYSNSGYMVLGLILEKITGEDYFEYMKKHVYMPAGMVDTEAFELDYVTANLATGYTRSVDRPGQWKNNLYANVVKGGPSGGSFSTAGDMLRFANALTEHKLLNSRSTFELTTGKVPYGARKYALGFAEELTNGHRVIGHGGGNVGISDELMIFTDLGYTVVILTNGDVDNYWNIQAFLKKMLLGPTPETSAYDFTKNAVDTAIQNGYEASITTLKNNPGKIGIRSGVIQQSGIRLMAEAKYDQAIAVLRLDVFAHPENSSVYESLAEAYVRAGDKTQAAELYKKYLSMEPTDTDAAEKLKKLERP